MQTKENLSGIVNFILNQFWTEAFHEDLLHDLGLDGLDFGGYFAKSASLRSKEFVLNVIDAYESQCAICRQSVRLQDTILGIDACHLKPLQHFGDDKITNGIALCKTHHWALDRGAISISRDYLLLISPRLSGQKVQEHFGIHESSELYVPKNYAHRLDLSNITYHQENIFVK